MIPAWITAVSLHNRWSEAHFTPPEFIDGRRWTRIPRMAITDFADPRLSAEIHVAEIPALILTKRFKVGERLGEPRRARFATRTSVTCGGSWPLPIPGRQHA
jgi:hypothetical protein